MPTKKCAWGTCNSDNRFKKKDYMLGVEFYRFPKPDLENPLDEDTIRCREWIVACNRPHVSLNLQQIKEDHDKNIRYLNICSKVS